MKRLENDDLPRIREWISHGLRTYDDTHQVYVASLLLALVDRLTAENRDLHARLAAFADGRPTIYREAGGPTP